MLQGSARGLFTRSTIAFSAGDHVIPPLGDQMPNGVVLGARGVNGLFAKPRGDELTRVLWEAYEERFGAIPVQAPFRMWQALLGLKVAVETAMAENGGVKPNDDQLAAAKRGSEWVSPSGLIQMKLGGGHQAIQPTAIGTTQWDEASNSMALVDIEYFAAECVNPPDGVRSTEWIAQGFPGAQCD